MQVAMVMQLIVLTNGLRVSEPYPSASLFFDNFNEHSPVQYAYWKSYKGKRSWWQSWEYQNFTKICEYQNFTLSKALTFITFLELITRIRAC